MDNQNAVVADSIVDPVGVTRDDNAAELRRPVGLNPYIWKITQQLYGTQNSELYRSCGVGVVLINKSVNCL
jgi:hypothetical protein